MASPHESSVERVKRLSQEISKRFKQRPAEIYLIQHSGHVVHHAGSAADVVEPFEEYCSQFPMSELRWEPEHEYGMVAKLVCACQDGRGCPLGCSDKSHRPRALFVLTDKPVGHREAPHSQ